MRTTLTILLLCSICGHAQPPAIKKQRIKNYVITGSLVLIAGVADGFNQALQFRYPAVKRMFPNLHDQFWNPVLSCTNKYKNGDPAKGAKFPGSRTWLVFTTDGYHATRFAEHAALFSAIAVKISRSKKQKWYRYAIEAAGYWLVHRVGFSLIYNHFKP